MVWENATGNTSAPSALALSPGQREISRGTYNSSPDNLQSLSKFFKLFRANVPNRMFFSGVEKDKKAVLGKLRYSLQEIWQKFFSMLSCGIDAK
jgi:hypothetical protein